MLYCNGCCESVTPPTTRRLQKGSDHRPLKIIANAIPNFVLGLLKLLYNAFAGLLGLILGDEFYRIATDGLWNPDFKVDLPIELPRLATGTVVPANYGEFLAVLGDNKRETEILLPISAMKQAMSETRAEFGDIGIGGNGDLHITIELDSEVLARKTVKWNKS